MSVLPLCPGWAHRLLPGMCDAPPPSLLAREPGMHDPELRAQPRNGRVCPQGHGEPSRAGRLDDTDAGCAAGATDDNASPAHPAASAQADSCVDGYCACSLQCRDHQWLAGVGWHADLIEWRFQPARGTGAQLPANSTTSIHIEHHSKRRNAQARVSQRNTAIIWVRGKGRHPTRAGGNGTDKAGKPSTRRR